MQNKDEKIVYQGKIIEVIEETVNSNGKELHLEKARRAPGVRLIIETPEGNFLLNKEKRHELEGTDFRLPGGKVFDRLKDYNDFLKTGGDIIIKAKEAAELEALQEVGIQPVELEYLYTSHCGATIDWDLIYFVVKKYEKREQQLEEHEDIETVEVTREELKELALSGKMQEDRSVGMILKYLNK
jgi:8-oxo-dGTP pyrophosphatase MutT (NUDIX family)